MFTIHFATPRLRSALLLGRIALLFTSRRALPARRLAALGARGALSTGCYIESPRRQTILAAGDMSGDGLCPETSSTISVSPFRVYVPSNPIPLRDMIIVSAASCVYRPSALVDVRPPESLMRRIWNCVCPLAHPSRTLPSRERLPPPRRRIRPFHNPPGESRTPAMRVTRPNPPSSPPQTPHRTARADDLQTGCRNVPASRVAGGGHPDRIACEGGSADPRPARKRLLPRRTEWRPRHHPSARLRRHRHRREPGRGSPLRRTDRARGRPGNPGLRALPAPMGRRDAPGHPARVRGGRGGETGRRLRCRGRIPRGVGPGRRRSG